MTAFLVLIAALVLVEIVAGVRALRHDWPVAPPASHPDWGPRSLPSHRYAARS